MLKFLAEEQDKTENNVYSLPGANFMIISLLYFGGVFGIDETSSNEKWLLN